jgi:agmatinase
LQRELCDPTLQPFLDTSVTFEDARFVVFGAPLDLTASYRSGSRFAPNAIRQASAYMETRSLRTGLDWGDVSVADIGDVRGLEKMEDAQKNIQSIVRLIHESGKIPVMMGGEHTITLGALRALTPDLVIDFDAHLDLRDQLFDLRLSHATFMRRAFEELPSEMLYVGCRAQSREEYDFVHANSDRITGVKSFEVKCSSEEREIDYLREKVANRSSIYITIDMDVLDPASAPAVGNPSPEGISVTTLLNLIGAATNASVVGFDLTEVTPHYDSGITAIQAAYIILETIYSLQSKLRRAQT